MSAPPRLRHRIRKNDDVGGPTIPSRYIGPNEAIPTTQIKNRNRRSREDDDKSEQKHPYGYKLRGGRDTARAGYEDQ